MPSIFQSLPGIPMPISEISKSLGDMWKGENDSASAAPSEFRASQLNLIVHMGLKTPLDEANEIFATAIQFTQKHPGRIIVLCPNAESQKEEELSGKLFTQCYIGESQRQMCCCEALLLEYCPDEPKSLFNQVSIWLESDLPVYHWFHRIPVKNVRNKHLAFVKNSKRILYDSQIEEDDYTELPIEDKWRVRDLADARMLPIKQSIGQILSTFPEAAITKGLQGIEIKRLQSISAGAEQLKVWLKRCFSQTTELKNAVQDLTIKDELIDSPKIALELDFIYNNGQKFHWAMESKGNYAATKASIEGRQSEHCLVIQQNDIDTVLSEAIFFGR